MFGITCAWWAYPYIVIGLNINMDMDIEIDVEIRGIPKPQYLSMTKLWELRSSVSNHQSYDNADGN